MNVVVSIDRGHDDQIMMMHLLFLMMMMLLLSILRLIIIIIILLLQLLLILLLLAATIVVVAVVLLFFCRRRNHYALPVTTGPLWRPMRISNLRSGSCRTVKAITVLSTSSAIRAISAACLSTFGTGRPLATR